MASEVTYAEVKFKNAPLPPPAETKGGSLPLAPPEKSMPQSAPQKPTWRFLWLVSALLLLLCVSLLIALIVTLLKGTGGCEEHKALPQSSAEWLCVLGRAEVKGQVWTCCPMGWKHFQSSCYYLSRDIMNWGDSETNCTGMGSHLVVINTGTEQDFIFNWAKRTFTSFSDRSYYIGLTDQAEEGQWRWVDQTPYNETAAFWRQNEPSNGNMENCAVMHIETKANRKNWNDIPCSTEVHRVCETAATSF
ncbi:C-type lectin domain family 4 member A-like isoform X1 [Chelonoidis abingdonii]|uniref:C-type lectin domain family 4 member A-like isoform X1 n=1 Tax=Chelonoidis abingdonii TaxID=106734 RepID=UPI0013F26BE1|nr:C-type lectin domain family 4 member A-like isoform X1 [Chelonoidis abingdonii]